MSQNGLIELLIYSLIYINSLYILCEFKIFRDA